MQNAGNIIIIIVVWYSRIPVQSRSPDVWKEALWVWETIQGHKHTLADLTRPGLKSDENLQKSKYPLNSVVRVGSLAPG